MRGLIIGKFYPPHAGHHFMIETALSECDQVIVLILANDSETIPGVTRADLLERSHPHEFKEGRLTVEWSRCNLPIDYESRDADRAHAQFIFDYLSSMPGPLPWRLYSSEPYGERIAGDLSDLYPTGLRITHRMVDLKRIAKPISATEIRRNPIAHWEALRGPMRAFLTKRVVICGAESSGTTTLSKALAERYQTIWVPEYGRTFSEAVGNSHRWTSDDFLHIIDEQQRLENTLAEFAGPVMFCDTDAVATAMFYELYLNQPAPLEAYDRIYLSQANKSLYIITDHEGVAFEEDGYRLFPHQREWATEWFRMHGPAITTSPWITVRGSHESRMEFATRVIDNLQTWDFGPAGDEL